MNCAEVRKNLGAYALGGLEPEEAAGVRRHLAVCAACREDLRDLEVVGHALDAAPYPSDPPSRLEEEIISQVRTERQSAQSPEPRRPGKGAIFASLAALAVLALALAFFAVPLIQGKEAAPVATVRLNPSGAYSQALRRDGYWGVAKFYPQGRENERVELELGNLRPPDRGGYYEAWVLSRDERSCAGTFAADPSGKTDVWLTVPSEPAKHRAVLVTLKSEHPDLTSSKEVVLRGEGH